MECLTEPGVGLDAFLVELRFYLRLSTTYPGRMPDRPGVRQPVLGFYRRRMALDGIARGQSGAVNVVQRTSADLRLAPHHHLLALDGVYVERADGELVFHALPRLRTDEVI